MEGVQGELDKLDQSGDSSHLQILEDEVFLDSRLLARLEKAEQAQGKVDGKAGDAYARTQPATCSPWRN